MKFATRILPLRRDRRSLDICFDLNTPPHHKFYFVWCLILVVLLPVFFTTRHSTTIWRNKKPYFLSLLLHIFALIRFKFSIGAFQIDANFSSPSQLVCECFFGFSSIAVVYPVGWILPVKFKSLSAAYLWYVLAQNIRQQMNYGMGECAHKLKI